MDEIKQGFNEVLENAPLTGEQVARIEILREYFTNPEFKSWLQEKTMEA